MSRPKDTRKKVEVARPSAPLQHNPFAALSGIEALQNLPTAPEKPAPSVASAPAKPAPKHRGRLVLRRETKERGGKTVVVIGGFAEGVPGASAVLIADLAKELKGKLGCGGTFDRQEITLQGDRAAAVAELLGQLGFHVRGVTS